MNLYYESELYHYGVKGMRWGIRKKYIRKGRQRKHVQNDSIETKNKSEYNKKGLTDKQKRAIKIGLAASATVLVSIGAYHLYKKGVFDKSIRIGQEKLKGLHIFEDSDFKTPESSPSSKFKRTNKKESIDEVIKKVNPTGSHNNCYNVVTAVAARLCGYDVYAKGDTQNNKGMSMDILCDKWGISLDSPGKDWCTITNPNVERIIKNISRKFSEGDVGAISIDLNKEYKVLRNIPTSTKAAHVFNWTIQNGEVNFIDGQDNADHKTMCTILSRFLDDNSESIIARFGNVNTGLIKDINDLDEFVK